MRDTFSPLAGKLSPLSDRKNDLSRFSSPFVLPTSIQSYFFAFRPLCTGVIKISPFHRTRQREICCRCLYYIVLYYYTYIIYRIRVLLYAQWAVINHTIWIANYIYFIWKNAHVYMYEKSSSMYASCILMYYQFHQAVAWWKIFYSKLCSEQQIFTLFSLRPFL